MKAHQRPIGLNDEWITPRSILDRFPLFHLDPCAAVNAPWRCAAFNYEVRGLERPWHGRVWLNPPFNRNQRPRWMCKMAAHQNGVMLVPAATETRAFRDYVWEHAAAVCFLDGRPHFHFIDGRRAKANCGTAIALVAYGEENARHLESANLGKTLRIK